MKLFRFVFVTIWTAFAFLGATVYGQFTHDPVATVVAQPAYVQNYKNGNQTATWQPHQTVTVYVDPSTTPETKAGVVDAINNWNQADVVRLVTTDDVNNADVRVINGQLKDPGNIVFGLTSRAVNQQTNQLSHATITINDQAINKYHYIDGHKTVQEYTDMVCTHEIGHALGLNHAVGGTNSVMQSGTDRNIQPYDIQRVRMLYHC